MLTTAPLVIGAYAALPTALEAQDAFYDGLAGLGATGLEVPDTHLAGADGVRRMTRVLDGRFPDSVVTAIPSTMGRQAGSPGEGLASPDEVLRDRALAFVRDLRRACGTVNDALGSRSIGVLLVHSAPTGGADADAFRASLEALAADADTALPSVWVEHCAAASDAVPGEKRFLPLASELRVAAETGTRVTLNWGRSVVETHNPATPVAHVRAATSAGALGGIAVSGAGGSETPYGPSWGDAHLPLDVDEPTSLLTADRVREFVAAAAGREAYRAVKIQVPADAAVERRREIIGRLTEIVANGEAA